MLQQKQGHAQIFRHAFDAQMEWQTRCYTKLTMPKALVLLRKIFCYLLVPIGHLLKAVGDI